MEVEEAAGASLNVPFEVLLEVVTVCVHYASVCVVGLGGDDVETFVVQVLLDMSNIE